VGVVTDPSGPNTLDAYSHTAVANDVPGNTYPFVFYGYGNNPVLSSAEMHAYHNATFSIDEYSLDNL